MGYGGYHPFPKQFGGGRPRLRLVHDALTAARGSAVDATNSSTVAWVEAMAYARAITFDGYGFNERLGLQWDPDRMTSFLSRWERILAIVPSPSATVKERRARVKRHMRRFIEATALHSRLLARLKQELGDVFVQIEYIDISNAVVHVPDPSYPWGVMAEGAPWLSTVAHILVLVQKPSGYTEGEFYETVARLFPATDGLIPAWATIDWYRAPTGYPAVTVSGGPSQAGFYLDADANLDNNVFDSYSPSEESGLTFWGDPRDHDAGSLAQLTDKSGNGFHFTEATNKPVNTDAAINNRRAMYFNGSTTKLTCSTLLVGLVAASACTVFVVYQPASVSTNGTGANVYKNSTLFGADSRLGLVLRTSFEVVAHNFDVGGNDSIGVPAHPIGSHVAYARHDGTSLYVSVDGGAECEVASGARTVTAVTTEIGHQNHADSFFHGYIGTVLTFNVSLSAAAIARVLAYLRSEWGL